MNINNKITNVILMIIVGLLLYGCKDSSSLLELKNINSKNVTEINIYTEMPNIGIITISNIESIVTVIDWLKEAEKPKNIGAYPDAFVKMNVKLKSNGVITLAISQPGINYATVKLDKDIFIIGSYPEIIELSEWKQLYSQSIK